MLWQGIQNEHRQTDEPINSEQAALRNRLDGIVGLFEEASRKREEIVMPVNTSQSIFTSEERVVWDYRNMRIKELDKKLKYLIATLESLPSVHSAKYHTYHDGSYKEKIKISICWKRSGGELLSTDKVYNYDSWLYSEEWATGEVSRIVAMFSGRVATPDYRNM
jgi:hypothetical protein